MRSERSPVPPDCASRRSAGLTFLVLDLEEPRAENAHGLGLVLDLALFVLTVHHDAGGKVRDAHRGIRRVDALSARSGGTHDIYAQISGFISISVSSISGNTATVTALV
jgi:hypothetical protein